MSFFWWIVFQRFNTKRRTHPTVIVAPFLPSSFTVIVGTVLYARCAFINIKRGWTSTKQLTKGNKTNEQTN